MGERFVKQFNVYLPIDLIDNVKRHATATNQSMSAMVEAALNAYLERARRRRSTPTRSAEHADAVDTRSDSEISSASA